MAESKFLKFQDENGDRLIDICEVELPGDVKKCLSCRPNPLAVVTNWTNRADLSVTLNEKNCLYELVYQTDLTGTVTDQTDSVDDAFELFKEKAVIQFLETGDKKQTPDAMEAVRNSIQFTSYDLLPRGISYLKLLYSLPFEVYENLEPADEEEDDGDEGPIKVVFDADKFKITMIRVRKGLHLYSRYQSAALYFGDGLKFAKTGKPLNVGLYGDYIGLSKKESKLKDVYNQIGSFLRERGYTLSPIGFRDKVTKIKFIFTNDYKLKKLAIKTLECNEKWIVFTRKGKLKPLINRPVFRDKTAMAYLANSKKMEQDLTARSPKPWADFLIEHTYPEVLGSATMLGTAEAGTGTTIASCITDNLQNEFKELGQDIFDETFGIFEAVATQFRQDNDICFLTDEKRQEIIDKFRTGGTSLELGTTPALALTHLQGSFKHEHYTFENLCEIFFGIAPDGPFDFHFDMLDELYKNFDTIRLCGLLDFMMEGVRCLMGGLSLQEALSKMCSAALRAMSLENMDVLFVGLPPDKQSEIARVVQAKLSSGQLPNFVSNGDNIRTLDSTYDVSVQTNLPVPPFSGYSQVKPGEEQKEEKTNTDNYGNDVRGSTTSDPINNRTLAQQYDGSTLAGFDQGDPDTIIGLWIEAILEVYADDLLGLTDILNKFPGAKLIANIISVIDCPRTPIFSPSLLDFLNSIDLPICRHGDPIVLPRLRRINIRGLFKIILQRLKEAAIKAIKNIAVKIILAILKKICEVIGNAICKALELVGDLAIATFSRQNFKDLVNKTLCGDKADDQLATDSIVDMLQRYGADAQSLANRERVDDFIGDIGSVMTAQELAEAFLGNPSEEGMRTMALLVQNRYPEFSDIFGTPRDIAEFFDLMGNVASAESRNLLADSLDSLRDQFAPANPSLCATTDQIDNFCAFRTSVLEGRCTQEELNFLCDNARTQNNALDDIADILQNGLPSVIEAGLPPLISQPGCDDGIFPYMDEQDIKIGSQMIGNALEQLKVDFTMDMIGNGPGEKNWGMVNLLLCDTDSDPLTTHIRQTERNTLFFKKKNVDFYVNAGEDDDANYAKLRNQHGAYPQYVAEWLFDPLLSSSYDANKKVDFSNDYMERKVIYKGTYDNNFDLLGSYDYGYGFNYDVDYVKNEFKVIRTARKKESDITMHFQDNLKGDGGGQKFSYAFRLNAFFHDIEPKDGEFVNTSFDSTRLIVTDLFKTPDFANVDKEQNKTTTPENDSSESIDTKGDKFMRNKKMEIFTIENTFDGAIEELSNFKEHFTIHKNRIPQLTALEEMTGISLSAEQYNQICDKLLTDMKDMVLSKESNERGFLYGATYQDLSSDDGSGFSDVDYGVNRGGEFVLYSDYASDNDISNDDRILGMSYMKFKEKNLDGPKNRVHYLDPELYGGSYLNPKVYIEPAKNKGWLGLVDVLFPEISPCKPYRVDLVDFGEIQSQIQSEYANAPEDKRLESDPDCVVEKPFNRILERDSKIGIATTIRAICRIYASAHIVKTLPVFTKIKPDLSENFSDIYSQYIVEEMADNFKDAQDHFELLNTFKDSEFWYSFLEQSVQYYSDLINEGKITNPPAHVISIMRKLNDLQESYVYPTEEDLKSEEASDTSLGLRLRRSSRLKEYRFRKNLEAVKTVEAECKIILKEILKQETQKMSDIFVKNAINSDLIDPEDYIYKMGYYFLQFVCEGNSLKLNKEIKVEIENFEDRTGNQLYTDGGEFSIASTGADYAGYYHSLVDEDGNVYFKTGEIEANEGQEKLLPLSDLQVVKIGDLQEWSRIDRTKTFQVVKYLKENGEKKDTSRIFEIIDQYEGSTENISDIYPGDLRIVEVVDESANPLNPTKQVGLQGELGLRYGLSLLYKGTEITSVEIDLLDLPISQAQPLKPNSKMLLCLINNMVDDPKFKFITEYVFPMKKFSALTAIYTDYALFQSMGEVTNEDSDNPGGALQFDENGFPVGVNYAPGWRKFSKRKKGGLFYLKWDEWNQQILRKSTYRTKKMFKQYYELRDFLPGDSSDEKPGQQFLQQIRESIKPAPGQRLLPWFRRRSGNPMNADGEVCKNRE